MPATATPSRPLETWSLEELLRPFHARRPPRLALAACLGMPPAELRERLGLGPARGLQLAAGLELGRRAVVEAAALDAPVRGGEDVYHYLRPRLAAKRGECFYGIYLDAKGRMVHERCLSEGTLTASLVHPREVYAPALVHRTAAVVVAHNHPSGDPEPSAEDRASTRRLQRAGKLLGVELLDHVVVGAGRYVSFLEQGWL